VVRFWDTSALLPLFIAEQETARAKSWLRADPTVVVWTLTRVELLSALARRRREEPAASKRLQAARQQVLDTWTRWSEVTAVDVVRRYAERLVDTYPLRAADALQLGAALVVAENGSVALTFVTFDRRQAEVAEREGFRVLGPE
jgi:uncharacterized protein